MDRIVDLDELCTEPHEQSSVAANDVFAALPPYAAPGPVAIVEGSHVDVAVTDEHDDNVVAPTISNPDVVQLRQRSGPRSTLGSASALSVGSGNHEQAPQRYSLPVKTWQPREHKVIVLSFFRNDESGYSIQETTRQRLLRVVQDDVRVATDGPQRKTSVRYHGAPLTASDRSPTHPVVLRPRIHQRDLRQLDYATSNTAEPFVRVRHGVILVKMDPYYAVITRDACRFVLPPGADAMVAKLVEKLGGKLDANVFEFAMLEMLMDSVMSRHNEEISALEPRCVSTVRALRSRSTSVELEQLRHLKTETAQLLRKLERVHHCLSDVLDDDEELLHLHLTHLRQADFECTQEQQTQLIEESVAVLEGFLQDVSELRQRLQALTLRMDSSEMSLTLRLDSARNTLLRVDTIMSLASLCVSVGALVGSVFGMNLASGVETSPKWFVGVIIATILFMCLMFAIIFIILMRTGVLKI
eukprot:m.4947 g.4947  ORF g.4947 m.4947 type:complete len:471 (+) comp4736_c0_seq1:62-1474(+)